MKYTDKRENIRLNPVYCEMLVWFDESSSQFDAMPADLEGTDKATYDLISGAYFAALHALDAVIDAHCMQQAVVAVQEVQQGSVRIDALADLYTHAPFQDALKAYRLERVLPIDGRQHTPEQLPALDAACERAERRVVEAVQEFARRLGENAPQ